MNLAVTAVVRPSRWFACIALAMCVVLLACALLIMRDGGTLLHHVTAVACALAAAAIGLFPLARTKPLRIDVSGIGQIRLVDTSPDAATGPADNRDGSSEVVQLLRGSTFWSLLMVLRLQTRSGRVTTLLIFPDSVDSAEFRALSVACRWVLTSRPSPAAQPAELSLPAD